VQIPDRIHSLHSPTEQETSGCTSRKIRKSQFQVTILSHEDGRWDLVALTRRFCVSMIEKQCTIDQLTEELVHSNLSLSRCGLADPDLILHFGSLLSLGGFLPWQIRLSEIFQGQSLKNIHSGRFISALKHYSKVEQRFGT